MKQNLQKLIKEVLSNYNVIKPKCNCGCNTCKNVGNPGPVLNENLDNKFKISKNLQYHINNKLPLTENTFRYGSESFLNLWLEARHLYSRNIIHLNDIDKEIINETNLGEYGMYEGKMVPLDLPMVEENTDKVVAILNNPNIEDDVKSMLFNAYKSGKLSSEQVIDIIKKTVKKHLNETEEYGFGPTLMRSLHPKDEYIQQYADILKKDPQIASSASEPDFRDALKRRIYIHGNKDEIGRTAEIVLQIDNHSGRFSGDNFGRVYNMLKSLKEAEYQGKEVQLGKPKRDSSGGKAYKVYVRDPKTKKVKIVRFGSGGLKAKINNPKARRAFAARQRCGKGELKTSAKWWSCRLPKFAKLLGLKGSYSGFW